MRRHPIYKRVNGVSEPVRTKGQEVGCSFNFCNFYILSISYDLQIIMYANVFTFFIDSWLRTYENDGKLAIILLFTRSKSILPAFLEVLMDNFIDILYIFTYFIHPVWNELLSVFFSCSLNETVFGETATALSFKEIRRRDP